jgi:signal transduction histidine kinase
LCIAGPVYALYRYQLHKKMEVEKLRLGIARDLHDDIGSALSNIHIISSMAIKKQMENAHASQVFGKIKESSKAMLENMQDIVWAINPENDTIEQVLAKMKEFAGELCDSAEIEYVFESDENLEDLKLNVYQRKDLFLIFKEAMNNAVKYSGGNHIRITLHKTSNGWLTLIITDNGSGFKEDEIRHGNGLRNMNERAAEMKGQVRIDSENGKGTSVELRIPIT